MRKQSLVFPKWMCWYIGALALVFGACSSDPDPSPLPPSESDLTFVKADQLCQTQKALGSQLQSSSLSRIPWGSGEIWERLAFSRQADHDRFYFYDQDQVLIGIVFRFGKGLNLKPFPILRETLSQLPPSLEFYLDAALLIRGGDLDSAVLYRTGDEASTTRYVVLEGEGDPLLLLATVVVDPYESLLAYLQKGLLSELGNSGSLKFVKNAGWKNQEDFLALQQFARGEVAWFSSCGKRNTDIALEAYQSAIQKGFAQSSRLAEAHHKLGLALKKTAKLPEAQKAIEQALSISPNNPTVLNSLGTVLAQRGYGPEAIQKFEQAIILKPNYAKARFNLAEALERINQRRAIEEYETYLALVEGIPEEANQAALAQQRVKNLKGE
jgi:tetratricopeptide (TPR) repeat protein